MKVLIAGCGWLGTALAERLVARGHEVLGLRRDPSKLPSSIVRVAADLSDPWSLRSALAPHHDVDTLVYAAGSNGRDDASYALAYDDGPARVIEALGDATLTRALFTSSTAVYDVDDGEVDETTPTSETGHARFLRAGEERFRALRGGIAFRLSGLYGPERTRLVQSVHEGTLGRDGRTANQAGAPGGRDRFTNRIHRDDAARAIEHLLALDAPQSIYVGVDEGVVPLSEVAAFLAERLGVTPPTLAGPARGKRCTSGLLRQSGFTFAYPTYREGYPAIVDEYLSSR
ncbi:MAG: NAD-dependent epimerase/dehydratase family protein [Sandaracinus sp.]|nr:NAD-dependent epimerase/dehydratase family protein [Sandaracinus sp.]MCB9620410.1 NAD-dependent epimerase/dehydratase family protein [Sandaracinus sp.]